MATLDDLEEILKSIDGNIKSQGNILSTISGDMSGFISKVETRNRLESVDTSTVANQGNTFSSNLGAGAGSAVASVGAGLGAGLGILSSIAGVGIGIAGFLTAMAAADAAIGMFGDGSNLKALMGNIAEGLAAFSSRDLTALGALLTGTVLFSSFANISSIVKAPVGLTAIGLGIGGFFTGLALGDSLGSMTGNNLAGFSEKMKNLSEGLAALSAADLGTLGVLLGSSALFGAAAGPVKSLKAATGMTLLGAGIGGFFAGLSFAGGLPGDNGKNLKDTMINLGAGLKAFDPVHLAALGTLMGAGGALGATGGVGKSIASATGMGMMGLGIGAFIAGIAAPADLAQWAGSDGSGIKIMMTNIGEGLRALDPAHLAALATMMTASGILGSTDGVMSAAGAATSMGLIGLGIGAFIAGIAAPGDLAQWAGADGSGIKIMMTNIGDGLRALDPAHLTALATMMTASGILGSTDGVMSAAGAATSMGLIGLGIGAFIAGIAAPGDLAQWLGADGSGIKIMMTNIGEGLKALDPAHLTALATMMTASGALGATGGGVISAAGAATSMGLIGIGIGAFIAGIAGVGDVAAWMGADGSGIKTMMTNIGDGLRALDPAHLTALAAMMTAGGALGATGVGVLGAAGAATSMGLIGLGIGAFIAGIAVVGDVAAWMGADGSGIKTMLTNIGEGLNSLDLAKITSIESGKIKTSLQDLADGLIAITKADLLNAIVNVGKKLVNFVSGEDGIITQISVIADEAANIEAAASAIDKLAGALEKIGDLAFDGSSLDMTGFAKDLVRAVPAIESAIMGGVIDAGIFGTDIEFKGLASPEIDYNTAIANINKLKEALGMQSEIIGNVETAAASNPEVVSNSDVTKSVEKVTAESSTPVISRAPNRADVFKSAAAATAESAEISEKPAEQLMQEERIKANNFNNKSELITDANKNKGSTNVEYKPVTDARQYSGGTTYNNTSIISPSSSKNDLNTYFAH